MIHVLAWAPSFEAFAAFCEAVQIAQLDPETGCLNSIADVNIHPHRPEESIAVMKIVDGEEQLVPGHHFNLRFYGGSEVTLTKPTPEGGWLPEHDLFDKTSILELVGYRTGSPPNWIALDGPIPPGYRIDDPLSPYDAVRAFDPALVASPRNVWA
jgi:hypothetical protein